MMPIDELACAIGERGGALDERLRLAVVVAACCAASLRTLIAQREIIAARRSVTSAPHGIVANAYVFTVCRIGSYSASWGFLQQFRK